jgi:hypothetical protein
MRGRPVCVLLRRFAPLAAVAVLFAPAQAFAGSPSPDRPPAGAPSGLTPDPVPGTASARHSSSSTTTGTHRPAYVAPVHAATTKTPTVAKKHAVVRPAHKGQVRPRPSMQVAAFTLPHIAVPRLVAIAPVRSPRSLDALLAGVALLLAAATAGSGARLVSIYNRRAGVA